MPEIPATAKKPADRKPKAEDPPAERVVTLRDHEWKIPQEALDDFELLDDMNALDQKKDATRFPALIRRILPDQWDDVMDVLRDEKTGRVSVEAGSQFVFELIQELNPNS